jgi:hypothetical protein
MKVLEICNYQFSEFENHLFDAGQKYPKAKLEEIYAWDSSDEEVRLYVVYEGDFDEKVVKEYVKNNLNMEIQLQE